jgi:hypothetical protein
MTALVLILSLLSLVISKAADFITTVRHVGQEGESNPLARRLFHRLGFRGGLIAVAMIWLLIVVFTYGYAWLAGSQFMQWLTSATGFFIACAQWDAARFNRTGSTSWFTRLALRLHRDWAKLWRPRRT